MDMDTYRKEIDLFEQKIQQSINFYLQNIPASNIDLNTLECLLVLLSVKKNNVCFVCDFENKGIKCSHFSKDNMELFLKLINIENIFPVGTVFYPVQLNKLKKDTTLSDQEYRSNGLLFLSKEIDYIVNNYLSLEQTINLITVGDSVDSFQLVEMLENFGIKLNVLNIKKEDEYSKVVSLIKKKLKFSEEPLA